MTAAERPGKALRWVDGKGTCLVPCTVLRANRTDRPASPAHRWVRFPDGLVEQLSNDYVLVQRADGEYR